MGKSADKPVDNQSPDDPGRDDFAPGFASSMLGFFGGRRYRKMPPITEQEKQSLIANYIAKHGITRCPPKLAEGYEGCLYGAHLV